MRASGTNLTKTSSNTITSTVVRTNVSNVNMGYEPGDEFQCLSIPITLIKERYFNPNTGTESYRSGLSIAGGVDQDHTKSPQGFSESGIYITKIEPTGPATKAGLKVGDRILQCNDHDFTLVTHKKAIEYIQRYKRLDLLILRKHGIEV